MAQRAARWPPKHLKSSEVKKETALVATETMLLIVMMMTIMLMMMVVGCTHANAAYATATHGVLLQEQHGSRSVAVIGSKWLVLLQQVA